MADPRPVPAVQITLNGALFDNALMGKLLDVQVRDSLLLPGTAIVRLRDTDGALIDDQRFVLGAPIEVKFGKTEKDTLATTFKGEVVAIEPEFTQGDLIISIRAYDKGWRLNRARKSRTFNDVNATDMVKAVAADVGLRPGTLESGHTVYEFFQQSMETDWEFCWRVAKLHNCEFVVDGDTFHFRPRRSQAPTATLKWGGGELLSFKPRLSGIGQVDGVTVANHDPATRQDIVGTAKRPELPHRSKAIDDRAAAVSKLGGGTVTVANRIAETTGEASALAQATLDRLSSGFLEAEGRAYGNPAIRAGATIKLDGVGRFSGEYVLTQTTHKFGGGNKAYTTSFVISGRTSHTFRDLLRADDNHDWPSALVIGIVTNNNDPQKLGRVRVKFPALGTEPQIEGGWARVITPSAGAAHGIFALPQVDDEVVVAFEHGDTRRPLVLGALFNGKDQPLPELIDASGGSEKKALFGMKTDHEVYVESRQKMTLTSHEKMTVIISSDGQSGTGDYSLDATGSVKHEARNKFDVHAGGSVTIVGDGSVTVEAKGALKLKGTTVDIEGGAAVNVKGAVINLG
jgi:uncharacterized protein involved in type VI secretion and phage assembly